MHMQSKVDNVQCGSYIQTVGTEVQLNPVNVQSSEVVSTLKNTKKYKAREASGPAKKRRGGKGLATMKKKLFLMLEKKKPPPKCGH